MRQFNCVGERETHPYVIPEIISQIANARDEDIIVRLGNNSYRDFLYAGDAVRMATELLEMGSFGEVYNMGSEDGLQIYELAELIGQIMEVNVTVREDLDRKRPWEIWHLQSDNTKLYKTIKYRPQIDLGNALTKTVVYFKNNGYVWDF